MEKTYVSTSTKDTFDIAQNLVKKLDNGTTICLYGPLAAGKTAFCQGVGMELGLPRVTSPTYIIMRQYQISTHPTIKQLNHLDLYRLNSPDDIKAFDLAELTSDKSNLNLIEWPEKFLDSLPTDRVDVYIKETGVNQREIKIKSS